MKKELSNKSGSNDFTPAGMNSDRGDFRFSGLVRQPLVASAKLDNYFSAFTKSPLLSK